MSKAIPFSLDGDSLQGQEGDTVASALLRAGVTTFTRSIKYHRPRGPFCLAGSCGQCLMRVDGVPSLLACRTPLAPGMKCTRQNGPIGVEQDLLRAADFLFPSGLDHHHLMVQSRLLGRVVLEVARRLTGLGELPDAPAPQLQGRLTSARLVVIGAGPAGLAAARAAAEAGAQVVLLERNLLLGGSVLWQLDPELPGEAWIAEQERAIVAAGGRIERGAEVVGLYPNDTGAGNGPALLAVRGPERLDAIIAHHVLVATGGTAQPLPFPGVDRPGVYAARGLLALFVHTGVRIGESLAVVGHGRELTDCARALERIGYKLARLVDATPTRALGNPVRALEVQGERIACDAVALAHPPAPLHDLASSVGAAAHFDAELNGFPLAIDEQGRTTVSWIWAAGRAAGQGGARAIASGELAGRSAGALSGALSGALR